MKSDIEIARSVELKKIKQVAESIGIPRDEVENYGRYIAKIPEYLIDYTILEYSVFIYMFHGLTLRIIYTNSFIESADPYVPVFIL